MRHDKGGLDLVGKVLGGTWASAAWVRHDVGWVSARRQTLENVVWRAQRFG
jgi:hypothetical protein